MIASLTVTLHAAVLLAAAPTPASWTIFDPYPGARMLCTQRIAGLDKKSHFTWWTYASGDAPEKVKAFYESRHRGWRNVNPEPLLRGPEDQRLNVDLATSKAYPRCRQTVTADDKTVITVTSGTVRSNRITLDRFDGATTGCGDAVVTTESRDGTRSLRLTLDRKALGLSSEPQTFTLPRRGLDLEVFMGVRRHNEILCHDPRTPRPDPFMHVLTPTAGRIVVSASGPPAEGGCYKISIRFEGVKLLGRNTEAIHLANLDLKEVSVGGDKPRDCMR